MNFDSKHLKAANHCIKYLHVIKFLIIRYSNSENEELNNQISNSNKIKTNKKISSTSNSKLNKKTSSNKENNDKQIFKKILMHFLQMILIEKTLKNIFINYLMIWSFNYQKTIYRFNFHHRSKISFDVTRWQKAHLMNTFLLEIEVWFRSKDNDLQW
jgi:hypothetical protein